MSTVAATVTAGYTWTADGSGNILLTAARLNLTAAPAVSVNLANGVAAEDMQALSVATAALQAESVTAAKLASALAALIPVLATTPTDDADGTGKVTIQAQNAAGATLSGRFLMRVWIAESEFGSPAAVTSFAPTTGTVIGTTLANANMIVMSNSSGQIVMDVDYDAAGTKYVMAEIGGRVYAQRLILTNV